MSIKTIVNQYNSPKCVRRPRHRVQRVHRRRDNKTVIIHCAQVQRKYQRVAWANVGERVKSRGPTSYIMEFKTVEFYARKKTSESCAWFVDDWNIFLKPKSFDYKNWRLISKTACKIIRWIWIRRRDVKLICATETCGDLTVLYPSYNPRFSNGLSP